MRPPRQPAWTATPSSKPPLFSGVSTSLAWSPPNSSPAVAGAAARNEAAAASNAVAHRQPDFLGFMLLILTLSEDRFDAALAGESQELERWAARLLVTPFPLADE